MNDAIRTVRQGVANFRMRTSPDEEGARFRAWRPTAGRGNNRDFGVKNGMLGAVERVEPGRLEVRLAGAKVPGAGRAVFVSMADHAAVDHGYATTIPDAPAPRSTGPMCWRPARWTGASPMSPWRGGARRETVLPAQTSSQPASAACSMA
ncbi:MAG: hypothetical protein ACOY9C_14410 [Pseudomonadota bacterium]